MKTPNPQRKIIFEVELKNRFFFFGGGVRERFRLSNIETIFAFQLYYQISGFLAFQLLEILGLPCCIFRILTHNQGNLGDFKQQPPSIQTKKKKKKKKEEEEEIFI